jgi:hypothetical protein
MGQGVDQAHIKSGQERNQGEIVKVKDEFESGSSEDNSRVTLAGSKEIFIILISSLCFLCITRYSRSTVT